MADYFIKQISILFVPIKVFSKFEEAEMNLKNMQKQIIDRIEGNSLERKSKLILFIGILMVALSIFKLFLIDEENRLSFFYWSDLIVGSAMAFYYVYLYQVEIKDRKRQFIEWQSDKLIFKLKKDSTMLEIDLNTIRSVNLDTIVLIDVHDQYLTLDISDFTDYDDRRRIKDNFEKLTRSSFVT